MEFVGRDEELKTLRNLYKMKGLKGAIVYGRRRLGKTSLLLESSKDFDGKVIYYQCLNTTTEENARQLLLVVNSIFPDVPTFGTYTFSDVISLVFSLANKYKILFILDEYPYLNDRDGIDSYLQSLIDRNSNLNLKIVLSGSFVNIMDHLLDEDHPLHGRFMYKILLQPFDYFDASKFYSNVSNEDKIRYYATLGGTPYYLGMVEPSISFEENIKNLFLSTYAPLESEINTTLREEYSKIGNATFLMSLIVRGKHSYTDINKAFKMQARNSDINYLLKLLIDMKFISKTYAINDKKQSSAYYELEDNLFCFYYDVIYPNIGMKPLLNEDIFFERYVKDKMNHDFIPHRFEKIAKEFLIRKNKMGEIDSAFTSIGSYTYNDPKNHKNGQFDVVTNDEEGNTFYECKFTKEKIDRSVVDEETRQLSELNIPYYRLGFFSKSGYNLEKEGKNLYFSLDDLFNL